MDKLKAKMHSYVAVRVLVGIIGLVLSVVLHELFHILMHWDRIRHIEFFPNPWTVIRLDAWIPPAYDLEGEEMAAYAITLFVLFITALIIFKIKDSEDTRSTSQILFPDDKEMQKLSPNQMLELSELDEEITPTPLQPSAKHRKP